MQFRINLQVFLFTLVFILTHQIKMYSCIMIFAFIHELGHLVAGMILKLKPKKLELNPFGVSILFEDYGYKKLIDIKKIIIASAGPITNIIISVVTYYLNISMDFKVLIIYSNVLLAFFNLLFIYPLDGGRILKCILRMITNKEKADDLTNKTSNILMIIATIFSSILILYYQNISVLFIITYLWIIVIKENRRYNFKKRMYKILQNDYKTPKCIDI